MVLYITDSGKTYSYRNGWLLENGHRHCRIIDGNAKLLLCKVRILSRLLRLEPRCASMIDDNLMLIAFQHQVIVLSIMEKRIINRLPARPGFSHPLNFCSLKRYGKKMVFWGDYGDNFALEPVNIYCMRDGHDPEVVYTFRKGMVMHVHNIIYDKWRDRLFIFTGDFGEDVGIYVASVDFKEIKPYAVGTEKYRAVQGLVTGQGLYWATDAVMSDNYVYFIDFETFEIRSVAAVNGSVIYGMEVNNGMLISTTVEPYPSSSSVLRTWLDTRLGPGIKSKEVIVNFVSADGVVTERARFEKDTWIMRLFQYGQVIFPHYENKDQRSVIINPMAVKKYDGKEIVINLE